TSKTYGYVDTNNNLLVVDAGSAKKAEDFASFLRKSLGSLKARIIAVETAPAFIMTSWLKETSQVPQPLWLVGEASLADPGADAGKILPKNLDLVSDEIQNHLANGMIGQQVALHFDHKMSFTVNDELHNKKNKFGELMNVQLDEVNAEA